MKRQPLIWTLLRSVRGLMNALPHRAALSLGSSIGGTVAAFSSTKIKKAAARVEKTLNVSEAEAREIARCSYRHFGSAATEFIRLPKMMDRLDEIVAVEGEEHMRRAYELGRGVILLSAHIGNWEYGAAIMAKHGFPMNAIGAEQRDHRITQAIEDLRSACGVKPIGKGFDLKSALACLKSGQVLCILLDQDARDAGVVSPFLGLPASTPIGPLKMAAKYGSAIVPTRIIRQPDGLHYKMHIEPALQTEDGSHFGQDVQYAADMCNARISAWIRDNPEQWIWMYPRWATTTGDR